MEVCEGFNSKIAYIDIDRCISIDEFSNLENKVPIKCVNGHELCFANGEKVKSYFRHVNPVYNINNKMTQWHIDWQTHFDKTEVDFKKRDDQIKDRRADVVLDNGFILEIQHSFIKQSEVNDRSHDYLLHGKTIYWLIHSDGSVIVSKLSNGRMYLEFKSDCWKYENFLAYDLIFLDIDSAIYKLYPKHVKSHMIDVESPYTKEEFVDLLKNNTIFDVVIPPQCNLFIKQQGAGNGKTYGIIQKLLDPLFNHYKCFVMVVKQHSAVHIIYTEFKQQFENGLLENINIIGEPEFTNKKFVIKYNHCGINKQIVIGTIDSFMYSLGNICHTDLDQFQGIVNSIIDGYVKESKCYSDYGKTRCYLNKEMCLICDETQDNQENYLKAIVKIMRDKYIDCYVVGDLLQSISFNENAYTYLLNNEFPYINTIKDEYTNVCRRFNDPSLINFVNEIIPFEKYGLPKTTPWKVSNETENNVILFEGSNVDAGENDECILAKEVETIMRFYIFEVETRNKVPNSFLIITPFTVKNTLVVALETAINEYWIARTNSSTFERFAIFHKSENGTSIDLNESENTTRIVSIHTSKGDGRDIVFVIGLNEYSLLKFSGQKDNLVYDSLFYVCLSRQKERIYLRVVNNDDDVSQKIGKYVCNNDITTIKPHISIPSTIRWNVIVNNLKTNDHFKLLSEQCIVPTFVKEDKKLIDMSHHNIRYATMFITLCLEIFKLTPKEQHISAIFLKFKQIISCGTWQEYYKKIERCDSGDICVLCLSNKGNDYLSYFKIINNSIVLIKQKLKYKQLNLCPFECLILYYMISITINRSYSEISINELYNIIDIYSKSFSTDIDGHEDCNCKKYFAKTKSMAFCKKTEDMQQYLITHYEKINKVSAVFSTFIEENKDVKWNIDKTISFGGNTEDFNIKKKFSILAYNNDTVWIIYIKPQFNKLNYNEFVIDSIYDTFLIKSINSFDEKNYVKFKNKKIVSIVFTSDSDTYYSFNWENTPLLEYVKSSTYDIYLRSSNSLYTFFKYYDYNAKQCRQLIEKSSPRFICTFFEIIERDLKRGKKDFLDKEYFNEELKNFIDEKVADFF